MRALHVTLLLLSALTVLPLRSEAQTQPTQPPPNNPFTLPQIITLLEGGFSAVEVIRRVGTACLTFRISPAAEAELRAAGADDALLRELRSVCFRATDATPASPRGIVAIVGELPPGWARVVNDLSPNADREIELTPGRSALIVVTAPGWCPDRKEVMLAPGDTLRWTPTLRGRPWVGRC